jgi:TIR domain
MIEKIYLSYAVKDRGLVGAAQRALRKHGIISGSDVRIMDHHNVKSGSNVREMIQEQILAANKVVIIGSDNIESSVWVNYEAGMAAALGKPIIVVGKKGTGKTASMLNAFGNVQFIEIEKKSAIDSAKGERREPLRR